MQPALRKRDDVADLFAQASAFHRSGDLAKAQAGYRKILKKRPNHFGALYQLGLSEHQSRKSDEAERLLKRALLVEPRSVEARYARAVVLSALQRDSEALSCFDDLLALKPDLFDAHLERGKLLSRLRRFADAAVSYDHAMLINPQRLDVLINKGEALHYLGRFVDAIACYDQLLAAHPTHLAALINRGCAFKDLRRADEAIADFDRALALSPDDTIALINRGETFLTLKRNADALHDFDRVIALDPQFALGWLGRANVLMLNKQVSEALEACQRALAIEPNSAKALNQIGQCHALLGDAQAAVACFDAALAIDPADEIALESRIFSLDFCEVGFAQHQAARSEWWRRIGSKIAEMHPPHHANDPDPDRRIVVGYVSGDFKEHSAARTFRPVIQSHDKSQVEVICYSNSPIQDAITDTFRQAADRWRDVTQWSDDQLADCIGVDKVDILVDLSGHSRGNRLSTFARKPAPIQVTAWGHATGTGLATMDYLFGDPVMAPPEMRHLFTEQIYDLPSLIIIEPPPSGLRSLEAPVTSNGHVTYGAFTRANRLSSAVLDVWARILRADVAARLLVKDYLLSDAAIQARLLADFAARGIAPERIDLIGPTSRDEHLAAHRLIDIWLDPFPNGGGVSVWEALHMGVPVVSKLGNGMCSRAGGAILSAIGMADWVATDDDEYVDIALRATPDRLNTLRRQLPDLIAERCAPSVYTRAVEAAYRTMWQTYCRGRRA
uniref:tetratricopeptide repeat protein n=1 Tax=Bradyrhizobium sp. (strain ORS 278) TaxID=114615 RepID=UPI0002E9F6E2|nr:tetratricopeptide repeat protein [Bradyrhizobium sp. ORS 278]